MNDWWTTCVAIWNRICQAAQAPTLQMIAVGGLSILAICYLLLTRTRLAEIKAVWKCIILSVVAHALLIVLAYGTHLMIDHSELPGGDPLVIRLMDDLTDDEGGAFGSPAAIAIPIAWERPAPALLDPPVAAETNPVENERPLVQDTESPPDPTVLPMPSPATAADANEERLEALEDMPRVELADIHAADADQAEEVLAEHSGDSNADNLATESQSPPTADSNEHAVNPKAESALMPDAVIPIDTVNSPAVPAPVMSPLVPPRAEPRRAGDGQLVPRRLALRTPQNRRHAAWISGGSDATESAVDLALRWLSQNQDADGRWSVARTGGGIDRRDLGQDRPGCGRHADTGITGLALLAFLGAGHSHLDGEHRATVANGLEFLLRSQRSDGCLGGEAQLYDQMYCHGIALLALADAWSFTGDHRLKPAIERGVNYTVQSQSTLDGGWRYRPGDAGDMSQFGWQVMALSSAELGGLQLPERTRSGMHRFLSKATRGQAGGLGCYRPGEGSSPSMTAEALVCRFLLERTPQRTTIEEATAHLQRFPPTANEVNYYYWYYGTLSMRMAGGEPWREWNERLVTALLSRQIIVGTAAGSWPADGLWSGYGGPVLSTALATLCLESYYRYDIEN